MAFHAWCRLGPPVPTQRPCHIRQCMTFTSNTPNVLAERARYKKWYHAIPYKIHPRTASLGFPAAGTHNLIDKYLIINQSIG